MMFVPALGPLIKLVAYFLVLLAVAVRRDVLSWKFGSVRGTFNKRASTNRVKVQFYMESLCIGCKNFMLEQLHPTYEILGDSVMDLSIIPFGNSEIDIPTKHVTCQHGPAECDANTYEQCAIHIYPFASRYLPFIFCLDNALTMGYSDDLTPRLIFADCARQTALDFASIASCHDDVKQAWRLQKRAARATPKEHNYVPWVVIDGQHTMDEEKDSLLEMVCRAYLAKGGHHTACADLSSKMLQPMDPIGLSAREHEVAAA